MEDQAPNLTTSPNSLPPIKGNEEKNPTMLIIIGVVVVIVIFAAAVFALSTQNNPSQTANQTQSDTTIKNTSDLDKISQELDKTDLDSYESELDQNDTDAADF